MAHDNDIGFQVRMLSNLIRRDVEKFKSEISDVPPQGVNGWAIDYFYENRDKDIFQRDFEEKFSIRRSTASNILKLMEKNGFITRVSVESDARLKKIILTEKAIQLHNYVLCDMEKREKRLRNGLTDDEIASFFAVMQKLISNMEDKND